MEPGKVRVPVFRPTMDEFRDFRSYIKHIEKAGAHLQCGIAKVIPPPEWSPRPGLPTDFEDAMDYEIASPIQQKIPAEGSPGCYTQYNTTYKKKIKLRDFIKLAKSVKYAPPFAVDTKPSEIERYYWKNIAFHAPIYGADTPGSLYAEGVTEWNINKLGTILDHLNETGDKRILGVNTAYLYFGMWKTTFPWHTEDMDLYSINYLHDGAPKYWYGIPDANRSKFERLSNNIFIAAYNQCNAYLRHKMFIISPSLLKKHAIPFGSMVQHKNEFMITFPGGYHAGFNSGFNIAESTNFASERWIDYGKNASICYCKADTVRIDMRPFVRRYQPQIYHDWNKYWYGEKTALVSPETLAKKDKCVKSKRQGVSTERRPQKKKCRLIDREGLLQQEPVSLGLSDSESEASNQNEISKPPPAHHTAITTVKDPFLVTDPLVQRLQNWRIPDFQAEIEWNRLRSKEEPHCCICQYFVCKSLVRRNDKIPGKSRRILTEVCFSRNPESPLTHAPVDYDTLFECCNCKIVVHKHCYGIADFYDKKGVEWRCRRCQNTNWVEAECRLCPMRGGALVPAVGGGWAHSICVLFNPNIAFIDPLSKSPVCIDHCADESAAQCDVCHSNVGSVVQCALYDCEPAKNFHATCGRLVGATYEPRDFPALVSAICPLHDRTSDNLGPIEPGSDVVAWLEEGVRVCRGVVVDAKDETFCVVDFEDGSFSSNLYPTDIKSCSCQGCSGSHSGGSQVSVLWTDGLEYVATFRRAYKAVTYTIRLNKDNKLVECGREELYGPKEILPPTVLDKLERETEKMEKNLNNMKMK